MKAHNPYLYSVSMGPAISTALIPTAWDIAVWDTVCSHLILRAPNPVPHVPFATLELLAQDAYSRSQQTTAVALVLAAMELPQHRGIDVLAIHPLVALREFMIHFADDFPPLRGFRKNTPELGTPAALHSLSEIAEALMDFAGYNEVHILMHPDNHDRTASKDVREALILRASSRSHHQRKWCPGCIQPMLRDGWIGHFEASFPVLLAAYTGVHPGVLHAMAMDAWG